MVQIQNIKALCVGVKPPVVRQSLLTQVAPTIGFYNIVSPGPDFIEAKSKQYRIRNLNKIIKSRQRVKLLDLVGNNES
jgi:lipid II:glycine glycyltransferase (peptidoglycan interpeptide bridge formation enzyme)